MRTFILSLLLSVPFLSTAQQLRPATVDVAYFGETATHPGLKVAATYPLKTWTKTKDKRGTEITLEKRIELSPNLGFYHHCHFQTGLFSIPELAYTRLKPSGRYLSIGLGAGYLGTIVPEVYRLHGSEWERSFTTIHYAAASASLTLGKDRNTVGTGKLNTYFKPQCIYAFPGTPRGVWYLALEVGVRFQTLGGHKN
ncbi:MAG: hypothetical protein R2813_01260 [Flavobacteriales bacterium]